MLLPGERPEELYRDEDPNARITSAYWQAMNVFKYARRIYIVGLSLSPLDAALGVALGMGLIFVMREAKEGDTTTNPWPALNKQFVAQLAAWLHSHRD